MIQIANQEYANWYSMISKPCLNFETLRSGPFAPSKDFCEGHEAGDVYGPAVEELLEHPADNFKRLIARGDSALRLLKAAQPVSLNVHETPRYYLQLRKG